MRVVVVGQGAREHALAWKLAQSPLVDNLWVSPGNAGTERWAAPPLADDAALVDFCLAQAVDLVVVGPEQALARGLVDRLRARGVRAFGPTQRATQLESSKIWARGFARRHHVAVPEHWVCRDIAQAKQRALQLGGDAVLKFDGLAAGKGVFVSHGLDSLGHNLEQIERLYPADSAWLVERRLQGPELSLMVLFDGQDYRLLPSAQDYKALYDGHQGPNTGGMGAVSPALYCAADELRDVVTKIVQPSLAGLQSEQLDFCGLIYFGLILTAQGPQLLEYNVRFGDPETQVVLPRIDQDLAPLLFSCAQGAMGPGELALDPRACVDVTLASAGYPQQVHDDHEIHGLGDLASETLVFHAGTRRDPRGRLRSHGGRVLNLACLGDTPARARQRVYAQVEQVTFFGMHYRRDIGAHKSASHDVHKPVPEHEPEHLLPGSRSQVQPRP